MPYSTVAAIVESPLDPILTVWLLMGIAFALWQKLKTDSVPWERVVFDLGCLFIASWQVASMILLFFGWYNIWTQSIVLSTPWFYGLWWMRLPSTSSQSIQDKTPILYGLLTCIFLGYLWLASPPPWMRDSLTYHLALAKQYAQHGQYIQTDMVVFGYFPQGWQSILTLFHSPFNGTSLFNPRFINVCITTMTSFGIIGFLKQNKCTSTLALFGGITYLLTPTILEFGTSCYVLPWLSMTGLWLAVAIKEERSLWTIGLLTGLLCSIKYSALIVPCILGVLVSSKHKDSLAATIPFWMGLLLLGSPFYLRNLILTGNPTFPLLYSIFGGEGWDTWRAIAYEITLQNYGVGREWFDYLLLPLRVFITRDMLGGFQGSLGPIWILFTIAALRKDGWIRWLFIGWSLFWSLQVQQIRFLAPILPWLLIHSIPTFPQTLRRWWPAGFMMSILWSIPLIQHIHQNQQTLTYWSQWSQNTQQADQLFLEHRLPENYPVYQHLNQLETNKVWLIWMRGYHYYLDADVRLDNVFGAYRFEQMLYKYNSVEVLEQLHNENISHLVINWRFFLNGDNADRLGDGATNRLKIGFQEMIQNGYLIPTYQWGPVWIYEVSESDSESTSSKSIDE